MTNEDGQIVVTYNGEIYNHPELRRELEERGHIFRTRCDTEVLVHGYEEWGVEMLQRLNGQFAFAIYDRNRDTVFIARDRFGVRPLLLRAAQGRFFLRIRDQGHSRERGSRPELWTRVAWMKSLRSGRRVHRGRRSQASLRWSRAPTASGRMARSGFTAITSSTTPRRRRSRPMSSSSSTS